MSVIVVGCGRSGTNMVLEILRGSSKLSASRAEEDKTVFNRNAKCTQDYLTKCDTWYFTYNEMKRTLENNPDMKIVWTIRDPRDMCMSKFRRGVPESEGGDCTTLADDATYEGCIFDIRKMYNIYVRLIEEYPNRTLLVRMENIIRDIEKETKQMCEFLNIPFEEGMTKFWERMRNKKKRERYKGLDKSQLEMWRHWEMVYDGWLAKRGFDIPKLFGDMNPFIKAFNYELS